MRRGRYEVDVRRQHSAFTRRLKKIDAMTSEVQGTFSAEANKCFQNTSSCLLYPTPRAPFGSDDEAGKAGGSETAFIRAAATEMDEGENAQDSEDGDFQSDRAQRQGWGNF